MCGIFLDQGLNPSPLHWQADSEPPDNQGSPALIPSSTIWARHSVDTLGCHWHDHKLGERKGHLLYLAPLSLPCRRPPVDWGLHSDPGWTRALEGHLQTRPGPLHAALPHHRWVQRAQHLPLPCVWIGLWPCPGGQHPVKQRKRKGAINLEPRASNYSRGSTSIWVSQCLCLPLWDFSGYSFIHFFSWFCARDPGVTVWT